MFTRFLHVIAAPFSIYYDLTIAEPCREVSKHTLHKAKDKIAEKKAQPHFSFLNHVRKQRKMTSPQSNFHMITDGFRDHYVQETHVEVDTKSWLH